jgi:hypothetical protein
VQKPKRNFLNQRPRGRIRDGSGQFLGQTEIRLEEIIDLTKQFGFRFRYYRGKHAGARCNERDNKLCHSQTIAPFLRESHTSALNLQRLCPYLPWHSEQCSTLEAIWVPTLPEFIEARRSLTSRNPHQSRWRINQSRSKARGKLHKRENNGTFGDSEQI